MIPNNINLEFLPAYSPELICGVDTYVAPGSRSGVIEANLSFERHIIRALQAAEKLQ